MFRKADPYDPYAKSIGDFSINWRTESPCADKSRGDAKMREIKTAWVMSHAASSDRTVYRYT